MSPLGIPKPWVGLISFYLANPESEVFGKIALDRPEKSNHTWLNSPPQCNHRPGLAGRSPWLSIFLCLLVADLRNTDVPEVGGKNASLGELYSELAHEGIRVPNGFAVTADAYREALTASRSLADELRVL